MTSGAVSGGESTLGSLVFDRLLVPWWERERARRLGRRLVAAMLPEAGREPWERSRDARFDARPVASQLAMLIFPAFRRLVDSLDREVVARRALEQLLPSARGNSTTAGPIPIRSGPWSPPNSTGSRSIPSRAARSATSGPRASPPGRRSSTTTAPLPSSARLAPASRSSTASGPTGRDDGGKVPFLPERPGPGRHRLPGPLTRPRAGVGFARVRSEVPVEGCRARPRPLPTPERSS